MKCNECHREATMDAPEPRCDLHWHLWFCGTDYPKGNRKRHIRYIRQNMRTGWREYGRPKDWRSQWREVERAVPTSSKVIALNEGG